MEANHKCRRTFVVISVPLQNLYSTRYLRKRLDHPVQLVQSEIQREVEVSKESTLLSHSPRQDL